MKFVETPGHAGCGSPHLHPPSVEESKTRCRALLRRRPLVDDPGRAAAGQIRVHHLFGAKDARRESFLFRCCSRTPCRACMQLDVVTAYLLFLPLLHGARDSPHDLPHLTGPSPPVAATYRPHRNGGKDSHVDGHRRFCCSSTVRGILGFSKRREGWGENFRRRCI